MSLRTLSALVRPLLLLNRTGALTLIDVAGDGAGGVYGLANPVGMAVSPSREFLYAAAAGPPGHLVFLRRERGSTRLVFGGADFYAPLEPTTLYDVFEVIVSRDGRWLYLGVDVNEDTTGARIGVFARDGSAGVPTFLDQQGTSGVFPLALIERRDGLGLFAADSERIVALRFDPSSETLGVTAPVSFGNPGLPVRGVPKAALLGDTLYLADIGNDRLQRFGVAPLVVENPRFDDGIGGSPEAGLDGADGLALSPDGKHLYVAAFNSGALVHFSRDAATGVLAFAGVRDSIFDSVALESLEGVAVSPDGTGVFAASSGLDWLLSFTRNPTTSALGFADCAIGSTSPGLDGVNAVATSLDGRYVIAAARDSAVVTVFHRSAANDLTQVQSEPNPPFGGFDGARGIGFGPGSVHVTAGIDDALVRFVPDPRASPLALAALAALLAASRRRR